MAADNNGDLAASLPDEILDYVLSLVSAYGDVRRCSLVCKRWHKAVARVAAKTRREFAAAAANRSLVWAGHSDPGGGKVCHGPHLSSSKCQVTGQVTLEISKRYRWVQDVIYYNVGSVGTKCRVCPDGLFVICSRM